MQEVVFYIDGKYDYLDELVNELTLKGYIVSENNISTQEFLIVTDSDRGIVDKYPYIFYETDENKGVKHSNCLCVIQGFDEIDVDFLLKRYQRYKKIPWTIAETDRLLIKELLPEDIDRFFEIYADSDIMKFCKPLEKTRDEEFEFEKAYVEKMYGFFEFGIWNIVKKDDGKIIGRAGFDIRDGIDGLELGFLLDASYREKGYAFEACRAIVQYGKEKLNADEIYCLISPENIKSESLALKLGFVRDQNIRILDSYMTKFTLI